MRAPSGPMQLRAFAKMRAQVVLAVPRVPQNRYPEAMRPSPMAFFSVRVMWSCPTTSSNVWGRYLRYRET